MTLVKIIIMIMAIETGGEIDKNNAVGDGGKAIGCLQIHPITVDEANRILDRQEFTLADRRSKAQSFRIASTVLSWRIRRYRLRYGRDPSQYDVMCSWQSGSIFKRATRSYREKVNRQLGPADVDSDGRAIACLR